MENSEKEYREKNNIYYGAMLSAWLNTKIERDKQLLTLSSSAIGLLVTLLRTIGTSTIFETCCYALSMLAFLITVISVLLILDENAKHVADVVDGVESESKILSFLDKADYDPVKSNFSLTAIAYSIGIKNK